MTHRSEGLALLAAFMLACGPQEAAEFPALLLPYLSELSAATEGEFDENGVFLGRSPHRERANVLFEEVLAAPPPAGDQAVAYLLFLYVGEHPGEELLCEAARRGNRLAPLIEDFSRQLPSTGLEPYPKFMKGSEFLPAEALRLIRAGENCGSH